MSKVQNDIPSLIKIRRARALLFFQFVGHYKHFIDIIREQLHNLIVIINLDVVSEAARDVN